MPVAAPAGRTDRNEDRACAFDPFGQVSREGKTAGLCIAFNQRFEPRLLDWHDTFLEARNLAFVFVYANDFVPEIIETGSRDGPK